MKSDRELMIESLIEADEIVRDSHRIDGYGGCIAVALIALKLFDRKTRAE